MTEKINFYLYWELFKTFFVLGAFTIGGGIVMIPLIERELVDNKQWLGSDEFLNMMGMVQSVPGAVAVNSAVVIGYKLGKIPGAIISAIGSVIPSFTAILVIATFFIKFGDHHIVQSFLQGARPAVVALLLYASYSLGKKGISNYVGLLIFSLGLTLLLLGIHPIPAIVLSGIAGYVLSRRGII